MNPKYPNVNVNMVGEDGNAFAILGRVRRELRHAGVSTEELNAFNEEATSGDYNHLLKTVMDWVTTDGDEDEDDEYGDYDKYDEGDEDYED